MFSRRLGQIAAIPFFIFLSCPVIAQQVADPSAMQTGNAANATEAPPSLPVAAATDTSEPPEPSLLPEIFTVGPNDLPHDLSPIGMFLAADWVVKAVMISLAFASLCTWTIWLAKSLQLTTARARANRTLRQICEAQTLDSARAALKHRRGAVSAMLDAAHEEFQFSDVAIDHAGGSGVKERVGSALARIELRAGRNMAKGTGMLATIGSTAPFVGLFGTVWGIMNSFIGISESNTTNLAVVAPGIAEALLATAIGLVAAIPAVIIYNVFARSIAGYRQLLGDAAATVERLVSRDLDFRKLAAGRAATFKPAAE